MFALFYICVITRVIDSLCVSTKVTVPDDLRENNQGHTGNTIIMHSYRCMISSKIIATMCVAIGHTAT